MLYVKIWVASNFYSALNGGFFLWRVERKRERKPQASLFNEAEFCTFVTSHVKLKDTVCFCRVYEETYVLRF